MASADIGGTVAMAIAVVAAGSQCGQCGCGQQLLRQRWARWPWERQWQWLWPEIIGHGCSQHQRWQITTAVAIVAAESQRPMWMPAAGLEAWAARRP